MDGPELITALSNPNAYTFEVRGEIEVRQTHISMLFFVDDRVFKVKKTVDMGFLDYSTIALRKRFCEEEVRLNRRLAAEIYLGVVPIVRDAAGRVHMNGESEVIDYAVQMRRLPESRMLDQLIEHGRVDESTIEIILDTVVPFHETCDRGTSVAAYGDPAEVRTQMSENLDRLKSFATDGDLGIDVSSKTLSHSQWAHLGEWIDDFVLKNETFLASRARDGFVRELHGDMHAGNICLREGGDVVIYDCIEYTPRYRCRDVACEMAYLAMDLDLRGRRELASLLIDRYVMRTNDDALRELDFFYRVSMAIVRALVESIRSAETEVGKDERDRSFEAAARYVGLAIGYTIPPIIVVTCGLPGTGKSWFAEAIAAALRGEWIRSDVVRKELAGLPPTTRDASIYTDNITRQTYDTMISRARDAIGRGESAVLDATFSTADQRAQVRRLADDCGACAILLVLDVGDEAIIKTRLADRAREDGDPSDADWAIFKQLEARFESPDDWPVDEFVRIDATSKVATRPEVVRRVFDQVIENDFTSR